MDHQGAAEYIAQAKQLRINLSPEANMLTAEISQRSIE